jgi:hypothetical protein
MKNNMFLSFYKNKGDIDFELFILHQKDCFLIISFIIKNVINKKYKMQMRK